MHILALCLGVVGVLLIVAVLYLDRRTHPRFWLTRPSQRDKWVSAFPGSIETVQRVLEVFVRAHDIPSQYVWSFSPEDSIAEVYRAKKGQLGLDNMEGERLLGALEDDLGLDIGNLDTVEAPRLRDLVCLTPACNGRGKSQ
jgi:hypothetical protein